MQGGEPVVHGMRNWDQGHPRPVHRRRAVRLLKTSPLAIVALTPGQCVVSPGSGRIIEPMHRPYRDALTSTGHRVR